MKQSRSFSESPAFQALSARPEARFSPTRPHVAKPRSRSQAPLTFTDHGRDLVQLDLSSFISPLQPKPVEARSSLTAPHGHPARVQPESHGGRLVTGQERNSVDPEIVRSSSPFQWWHSQGSPRSLPVTWAPDNNSEQSLTSSCLTSTAGTSPIAPKRESPSPTISEICDPGSFSSSPPPGITRASRPRSEEQVTTLLPTPVPASRSYSRGSSKEPASKQPPRDDAPRQFLSAQKRTTPRGFKQLQKTSDIGSPDRTPGYSLGDGFSKQEAVPTGLSQVSSKRKAAHFSVPLGELELTQSIIAEPEQKEKKRRFTRTRKRAHQEDNAFDLADLQLNQTTKKRALPTADGGHVTGSQPRRLASPVLGEFETLGEGQDCGKSQQPRTPLVNNVSGNAKTEGPARARLSRPAAADARNNTATRSQERQEEGVNTRPTLEKLRGDAENETISAELQQIAVLCP